jgi:hypothetical protein
MAQDPLSLDISEPAQFAYSTLGPDERRLVDGWFEHLRNWHNDEFIRSKSKRLESDGEIYVFQTSADLVIAFEIAGSHVTVLSLFRKEALRKFATAEPTAT